jgi:hypothetical protein
LSISPGWKSRLELFDLKNLFSFFFYLKTHIKQHRYANKSLSALKQSKIFVRKQKFKSKPKISKRSYITDPTIRFDQRAKILIYALNLRLIFFCKEFYQNFSRVSFLFRTFKVTDYYQFTQSTHHHYKVP